MRWKFNLLAVLAGLCSVVALRTPVSAQTWSTSKQNSIVQLVQAKSLRLDYRKGASGNLNLTSGWTPPGEAIGVWTDGPKSIITLEMAKPTRPMELLLVVGAYIVPKRAWQESSVYVGSKLIGTYKFDQKTFEGQIAVPIWADDVVDGHLVVTLNNKDPRSPAELGLDAKDKRHIAIALRELTVHER